MTMSIEDRIKALKIDGAIPRIDVAVAPYGDSVVLQFPTSFGQYAADAFADKLVAADHLALKVVGEEIQRQLTEARSRPRNQEIGTHRLVAALRTLGYRNPLPLPGTQWRGGTLDKYLLVIERIWPEGDGTWMASVRCIDPHEEEDITMPLKEIPLYYRPES